MSSSITLIVNFQVHPPLHFINCLISTLNINLLHHEFTHSQTLYLNHVVKILLLCPFTITLVKIWSWFINKHSIIVIIIIVREIFGLEIWKKLNVFIIAGKNNS